MIQKIKELFLKENNIHIEKEKIIDIVNAIIISLDSKGRVIYINDKGCDILGYKQKDILNKNWFNNFLPKKVRKDVVKIFDSIMKGNLEPAKHFENPVIKKDGTQKIISWHNTYIKDDEGNIIGIMTSGQDITEEKETKKKLEESEKKYRDFVNNSQDIICSVDVNGIINFISPNASKFGYSAQEIIGKKITEFLHPKDLKKTMHEFKCAIDNHETKINRFRLKDKKGNYHYIEETGKVIKEDEKIIGIVCSLRDVTENIIKEQDLLKFKAGIEKSNSSVFITDTAGHITYINPAFGKLYGFSEKDVLGRKPNIIKSGLLPKRSYKEFWNTLLSKKSIYGEIINKTKSGDIITVSGSVNPILDENENIIGFLSIHNDISEMKKQNTYLKTIIDSFPSPLYIIDANNYDIVLTNNSLDIPKGKTVKCYKQTHKRDSPCRGKNDICPLREIKKTKQSMIVEHTHFDNEGNARLYQVRAYPIFNEKREVTHIIETSIDITEQKRYQEKIEESEKKFRMLFDNANDLIQNIDSEGNIKFVNKKWIKTLGYGEEELKDMNIFDLIKEEDKEHCKKIFKNLLSGGSSENINLRMISKSGKEIMLEGNANQITTDKSIETIGIFRDVTEKKKIEDELKESKKQLEEKIDNLERFNRLAIDRELKMIELKKEIKKLKGQQ